MIKIPLTVETKEEGKQLRSTILHLLGDKLYQRHPEKYDNAEVPEPLASSRVLGTPTKSHRSTFGSILTFKGDVSFAMLSLKYDPQEGIGYRLGAHAGWHKGGTEEDLHEYHKAFDTLLDRLGVLADSYCFTCPCGDEGVIEGGYTDVVEYINKHDEEDHNERRISTSTLIGREVSVNTRVQQPQSGQRQQANS